MTSNPQDKHHQAPQGRSWFLSSPVMLCLLATAGTLVFARPSSGQFRSSQTNRNAISLEQIPFDGQSSMAWINKICDIGPRVSGTEGMQKQQQMLVDHFQSLGGNVSLQKFAVRHPLNGSRVPMANLVVRWHPDREERILLCAHYDTRPFPDQDPVNPKGVFLGANDGASGVAVLAVMGRHMGEIPSPLGVDFVLFDGEELVYNKGDRYFYGSEFFAREYAGDQERDFKYRAAVLLDMVGDKNLELRQERNSLSWRDSRWIVNSIWKKADRLGVREFVRKPYRTPILDDHIMLHRHGKIPACDIIDFAYRSPDRRTNYWHTTQDTPDKCSAESLAKVGWVVHEWLKDEAKKRN